MMVRVADVGIGEIFFHEGKKWVKIEPVRGANAYFKGSYLGFATTTYRFVHPMTKVRRTKK